MCRQIDPYNLHDEYRMKWSLNQDKLRSNRHHRRMGDDNSWAGRAKKWGAPIEDTRAVSVTPGASDLVACASTRELRDDREGTVYNGIDSLYQRAVVALKIMKMLFTTVCFAF